MASQYPYFGFFPALRINKSIELGDWLVGEPPPDTPWRSNEFRELAIRLVQSVAEQGFADSALLWHRERGFSGECPASEVAHAIQTAVGFAVLDANDHIAPDDLNRGSQIATTENAELYLQPVDERTVSPPDPMGTKIIAITGDQRTTRWCADTRRPWSC
jgi:hypothetical protein